VSVTIKLSLNKEKKIFEVIIFDFKFFGVPGVIKRKNTICKKKDKI
jgi:hypothetical protein